MRNIVIHGSTKNNQAFINALIKFLAANENIPKKFSTYIDLPIYPVNHEEFKHVRIELVLEADDFQLLLDDLKRESKNGLTNN